MWEWMTSWNRTLNMKKRIGMWWRWIGKTGERERNPLWMSLFTSEFGNPSTWTNGKSRTDFLLELFGWKERSEDFGKKNFRKRSWRKISRKNTPLEVVWFNRSEVSARKERKRSEEQGKKEPSINAWDGWVRIVWKIVLKRNKKRMEAVWKGNKKKKREISWGIWKSLRNLWSVRLGWFRGGTESTKKKSEHEEEEKREVSIKKSLELKSQRVKKAGRKRFIDSQRGCDTFPNPVFLTISFSPLFLQRRFFPAIYSILSLLLSFSFRSSSFHILVSFNPFNGNLALLLLISSSTSFSFFNSLQQKKSVSEMYAFHSSLSPLIFHNLCIFLYFCTLSLFRLFISQQYNCPWRDFPF